MGDAMDIVDGVREKKQTMFDVEDPETDAPEGLWLSTTPTHVDEFYKIEPDTNRRIEVCMGAYIHPENLEMLPTYNIGRFESAYATLTPAALHLQCQQCVFALLSFEGVTTDDIDWWLKPKYMGEGNIKSQVDLLRELSRIIVDKPVDENVRAFAPFLLSVCNVLQLRSAIEKIKDKFVAGDPISDDDFLIEIHEVRETGWENASTDDKHLRIFLMFLNRVHIISNSDSATLGASHRANIKSVINKYKINEMHGSNAVAKAEIVECLKSDVFDPYRLALGNASGLTDVIRLLRDRLDEIANIEWASATQENIKVEIGRLKEECDWLARILTPAARSTYGFEVAAIMGMGGIEGMHAMKRLRNRMFHDTYNMEVNEVIKLCDEFIAFIKNDYNVQFASKAIDVASYDSKLNRLKALKSKRGLMQLFSEMYYMASGRHFMDDDGFADMDNIMSAVSKYAIKSIENVDIRKFQNPFRLPFPFVNVTFWMRDRVLNPTSRLRLWCPKLKRNSNVAVVEAGPARTIYDRFVAFKTLRQFTYEEPIYVAMFASLASDNLFLCRDVLAWLHREWVPLFCGTLTGDSSSASATAVGGVWIESVSKVSTLVQTLHFSVEGTIAKYRSDPNIFSFSFGKESANIRLIEDRLRFDWIDLALMDKSDVALATSSDPNSPDPKFEEIRKSAANTIRLLPPDKLEVLNSFVNTYGSSASKAYPAGLCARAKTLRGKYKALDQKTSSIFASANKQPWYLA